MTLFPDIKPGDEVAIAEETWSRIVGWRSLKVERVTKTQIITVGDVRWRREDGHRVGGGAWHGDHIYPWTEELRAEQQHLRRVKSAEKACQSAANRLNRARGDEALRLAALLPDELKEPLEP